MENAQKGHNALEATLCRRRTRRTILAVEVELSKDGVTVSAIIRDASLNSEADSPFIGIGLFHNHELPLDATLICRTVSPSELLPIDSTVSLMWTRHFGQDGFLSGGKMARNHAAADPDCEIPKPLRQGADMTHKEHVNS